MQTYAQMIDTFSSLFVENSALIDVTRPRLFPISRDGIYDKKEMFLRNIRNRGI